MSLMMLSQVVFDDFTSSMSDDEADCNIAAEQAESSSAAPTVDCASKCHFFYSERGGLVSAD
jgi:hypothetical protein